MTYLVRMKNKRANAASSTKKVAFGTRKLLSVPPPSSSAALTTSDVMRLCI
jgi:hypothetical protein